MTNEEAIRNLDTMWKMLTSAYDEIADSFAVAYTMAVDALKAQLPSAQQEIIKCRDCKYWREHKYAKETKRYIPFCGFNAIYTKADDFCSRAERRIDE